MSDTHRELREWVELVADEIEADDGGADKEDLAYEAVDGSEWVIYYSKAADVLSASTDDAVERAYSDALGDGAEPESYASLQVLMAYHVLRDMLNEELGARGALT
jgi:hypothetical protein